MKKVKLGNTGLEVSKIGFGGIPIQRVTAEETIEIFGELIKEGINFIDSARGYTVSEMYIGKALQVHGRENFILATKTMVRDARAFYKDFEISAANMQTDYIDLYQFHNVKTVEEYEIIIGPGGAYEAAADLKEQGKIGHIGITSHNKDLLPRVIESGLFETIQFPYNPVELQGEDYLKQAHKKGIGTIIMKPVAGGAIMNKELALRYICQQDFLDCMIPGMDSIEQVQMNAKIGRECKPLTEREQLILDDECKELGSNFCRRCEYCLPCPVGIDIPANFLMAGYYTRYNLEEWASG